MHNIDFHWELNTFTESKFRAFVRNKFYENKEERMYWHMPCLEMAEYVSQNKWYLKKIFKQLS